MFSRFDRSRWVIPALFALAIGLRLALMLWLPQRPMSDSEWYLVRAAEMARGMGYQEAGHPTAFWPVGYPALIAASLWAFGPTLLGPMLVNLVAAAAMAALVLWFARALGAGERAARIALLLYAVYPASIAYAGQPAAETTSTAVALAAFALLIAARDRAWPLVAGGLLFGAATLMRAQMLLFPAGAIAAMTIALPGIDWRRAIRAGLLVYVGLAAVVLPWSIRNWREMGAAIPVSTNGGVALFYGANPRATGEWYNWERTPIWDSVVPIPYAERVERQVELDRWFKAAAKRWIAENPGRWTMLGFRKAAMVWHKDTDGFWALDGTYPGATRAWRIVQALDQLFYLAVLGLGAAALAIAARARMGGDRAAAPLLLLACMPAFVTLTAFVFTGQTRYHYPAMPFLLVAAGWTLARLSERRPRARTPSPQPA